MFSKMTRLAAMLLLSLLSGCFVSSDKELITTTMDPGFPTRPFSLHLDQGPLSVGTNGLLSVSRGNDHFAMQDALKVHLFKISKQGTVPKRDVKFKKLRNARNLYIAQDKTSGSISYFLVKWEGDGFWLSQMKLSPEELATAAKQGLSFVGKKSVSVNKFSQIAEYARYWHKLKGPNWNPKMDGVFHFDIVTRRATVATLLNNYVDAACLAAAGHPEDPDVRNLPEPLNYGMTLLNIKSKDVNEYCQHGLNANAKPSVRYALARGLFSQRKYTGSKSNPGALDIATELMDQKYPLAYVLLADAYVQGSGVPKNIQKAKQILDAGPANDPNIQYMKAMHSQYGTFGPKNDVEAMAYAKKSSAQNHGGATTWLGKAYANGWGVKKNAETSVAYFSKAADLKNVEGMVEFGKAFYFGKGVPRDYSRAFQQMRAAATQKNPEANYFVGFMYRYGQGVKKDRKKALSAFNAAIQKGNQLAKYEYAELYYDGSVKSPPKQKYHNWLVEGADKKRRTSQYILGKRYLLGTDVEKSVPKGLVLLDRASQQGLWNATNYMASLYETGNHVKKDIKEAQKLYRKSALAGSVTGQRKMAHFYEKGIGVPQNTKEVQKWYQMAANKGDISSQVKLGVLMENSDAANPEAFKTALSLYQKAHARGNSEASWRMGRLYASGKVGKKDIKTATKYYRASADRGNSEGKIRYGYNLAMGLGVTQDKRGAKAYYVQAAEAGYARAMYFLGLGQKNGLFGEKNNTDSEKWLSKALASGMTEAREPLNQLLNLKSSSLTRYEQQAATGDVTALYNTGYTYLNKMNNAAKAETYFVQAAQKGDLWSQYYMGVIHGDEKAYPQHWEPQHALMWLYTAERTGLRDGKKVNAIIHKYQQLERQASAEMRIRATENARKCFSSNYQVCR